MLGPWPWYVGGVALASFVLSYVRVTGRLVGVSGLYGALVDRLRLRTWAQEDEELTPDELLEALRQETSKLEGSPAPVGGECGLPTPPPQPAPAALRLPSRSRPLEHLAFFLGLVLGGALAAAFSGSWVPIPTLAGAGFEHAFGDGQVGALFGGRLLVGFGTRMCGGCTSGHGLCGMGRLQPGSAAATAAFFGGGVIVARILEALWS